MIFALVAATAAAASAVGTEEPGWARFSRTSTFFPLPVRVSIGTLDYDGEHRLLHYWMRREQTGFGVTWTDSRRCPQVRDVLRGLRYLGAEPDGPKASPIMSFLDSATYALETPGQSGSAGIGSTHLTSGNGTALARWVDTALATLEPCWSPAAPSRSDG